MFHNFFSEERAADVNAKTKTHAHRVDENWNYIHPKGTAELLGQTRPVRFELSGVCSTEYNNPL